MGSAGRASGSATAYPGTRPGSRNPSWVKLRVRSQVCQLSAIVPSTKRSMLMPGPFIALPEGGLPANSPSLVPETVK